MGVIEFFFFLSLLFPRIRFSSAAVVSMRDSPLVSGNMSNKPAEIMAGAPIDSIGAGAQNLPKDAMNGDDKAKTLANNEHVPNAWHLKLLGYNSAKNDWFSGFSSFLCD